MAPGTHITTGVPQSNYGDPQECDGHADKFYPSGQTLYTWSNGTSMAAPAVSGGAALLFQDFLNKSRPPPSPAMVKAYLMNSAAYMTGVGDTLPSNQQGMGRLDLGRAFDGVPRLLTDQSKVLSTPGEFYQVSGWVENATQPFRVTLAWTDPPSANWLNPWMNNLDLTVTLNGITYKGNVFSGATSTTGGNPDGKNNTESVFLPAGSWGNFTVTVKATSLTGDGVPGNADTTDQDFALVIYNANADTQLLSNGGLEGSLAPWKSGNAFHVSNGFAHTGTGYLYMKVNAFSKANASQEFTIPATATSAQLSFWLNVTSSEVVASKHDRLFIEVIDPLANTPLQALAEYSDLDKVPKQGAYSFKGAFNLLAHKGKKVRLQFRAESNEKNETIFRIDDVLLLHH
jgi:hypothetical protein